MSERTSVTVPLTARQKEQIKRVTGKSIGAFKVEASPKSAPRLMLARRPKPFQLGSARKLMLGRKGPAIL